MSSKDYPICKGFSRTTGLPCKNHAVDGSDYCKFHGGGAVGKKTGKGVPKGTPKPPGSGGPPPRGSTHSITYGAYTSKMPPEMRALREELVIEYFSAVDNPTKIDKMTLERAASLETKLAFALDDPECPASTIDILTRVLHRELKSLKITREQQETSSSGTTPVEVIAAIMKKVEARRKQLAERGRLEAPMPAPSSPVPARREVIDVEPVVHEDPDPDPELPPIDAELEEEAPDDPAPDPDVDEAVDNDEDEDWWPED